MELGYSSNKTLSSLEMESKQIQRRASSNRIDSSTNNDPKLSESAPSDVRIPGAEIGARKGGTPIVESGPDAVCSSKVQLEICSETSNRPALS
jgi:hypothetical protein